MKNIVMFSGGLNSFMVARMLSTQFGPSDIILLFSDTLIEDKDLYRFLFESAEKMGLPLIVLTDGRTPWEVFKDVRMIGNTRMDPCSRLLKRDIIRKFVDLKWGPGEAVIFIGIDWTETHRAPRIEKAWEPYEVMMPLMEEPYFTRKDILIELKELDIEPPRMYEMGFAHNNCGGFCIKAGHGQFKLLLEKFPDRYEFHEHEEQKMREYLDKDVAILRDRRGGTTKPLTMTAFREMVEKDDTQLDLFEHGGCGCFTDY